MDVYLNENGGVSGRGERRCLLKCNQFFICYIQFLLSKRTPPEEVAFQNAKWHLNRSQFGIRIDHDLASISDHSLASQSITIWHASDH